MGTEATASCDLEWVRCGSVCDTRAMAAPMTTELLVEQAGRLGQDGLRFTARQLYYACCRAVEQPPPSATRGIIGTSALLILLAAALVRVQTTPPVSPILALIGAAGLLLALLNAHVERGQARERARASRPLAVSFDAFAAGPLSRALRDRPEGLRGLVGSPAASADGTEPHPSDRVARAPGRSPAPGGAPAGARRGRRMLVVCDRPETALLMTSNLEQLPAGTQVIDGSGLGIDGGAAPALSVRRRRVVALHDADPAGCGLASRLRLAGAAGVDDAGLLPPATDTGLQVIEGAPARTPAGIEADLTPEQIGWLLSGRRLELATLGPPDVVAMVLKAAGGAGPAPRGRGTRPPQVPSAAG